jgi:hypothetical protein
MRDKTSAVTAGAIAPTNAPTKFAASTLVAAGAEVAAGEAPTAGEVAAGADDAAPTAGALAVVAEVPVFVVAVVAPLAAVAPRVNVFCSLIVSHSESPYQTTFVIPKVCSSFLPTVDANKNPILFATFALLFNKAMLCNSVEVLSLNAHTLLLKMPPLLFVPETNAG